MRVCVCVCRCLDISITQTGLSLSQRRSWDTLLSPSRTSSSATLQTYKPWSSRSGGKCCVSWCYSSTVKSTTALRTIHQWHTTCHTVMLPWRFGMVTSRLAENYSQSTERPDKCFYTNHQFLWRGSPQCWHRLTQELSKSEGKTSYLPPGGELQCRS